MPTHLPRIALFAFVLGFIVLLFLIMDHLSFYLVPAGFGALLAMLLLPLNRRLERIGCSRILAISLSVVLILAVFFLLGWLFTTQILNFADDLPTIREQLKGKFTELQEFVTLNFGVSSDKQMKFMKEESDALLQSAGTWGTGILLSAGAMFAGFALILVHIFLFLLYRGRIKKFFLMVLPDAGHAKAESIIEEIATVTRKYLTGVVTVMIILSILNSIGLLALGIPNAIFFGILAAVLNVVPYIGVWIGSALPIFMAIISKDSMAYPIGVIAVFSASQFIDNHFLTPRITGSQVRLNALAAIAIIIIGDIVWGLGGMILFVPMAGMLKIVFDNIDSLKPFGYVIGDDHVPGDSFFVKQLKRLKRKKNPEATETVNSATHISDDKDS